MARNIFLFAFLSFACVAYGATKGDLLQSLLGSPCEACRLFVHNMALDVCADINAPGSCVSEIYEINASIYCYDECKGGSKCD